MKINICLNKQSSFKNILAQVCVCICAIMYMYVNVKVCVGVREHACMCLCMKVRGKRWVSSSGTSSTFLEEESLSGLEFISWSRLAGQQALESIRSPLPLLWNYNYIYFYVGSGDQTQVLGKYFVN